MAKIAIDATNLILGRLCTYAAKQSLLGSSIEILNCEESVIRGSKENVLNVYKEKFARGTHAKGPFYYRRPDFFVKRTIRGMLPHKSPRGKAALKQIKCHIGSPEEFMSLKLKTLGDINILNRKSTRKAGYIKVKDLCRYL